jgi:hypothetical protein
VRVGTLVITPVGVFDGTAVGTGVAVEGTKVGDITGVEVRVAVGTAAVLVGVAVTFGLVVGVIVTDGTTVEVGRGVEVPTTLKTR